MDSTQKQALRTFLENTDRGQLIELILEACQTNEEIYAAAYQRMQRLHGTPFQALRRSVDGITDANFLGWHEESTLAGYLSEIIEHAATTAQDQRTVSEAIDMLVYVVQTACRVDECLEEGWQVDTSAEDAVDQMQSILDENADERSDALVQQILKAAEAPESISMVHGPKYALLMLRAAAAIADDEERRQLLEAADRIADGDRYMSKERDETKQIILSYADAKTAENYMRDHLDSDTFRSHLIQSALDAGDYERAEQLCLERIDRTLDPVTGMAENARAKHEWYVRLHDIYAASGDTSKLTETTCRLVCSGDAEYFSEAKQLLTEAGRWDKERPRILNCLEGQAPPWKYLDVLHAEREPDKMLEHIVRHPDLKFQHGAYLYKERPAEYTEIVRDRIQSQADAARNRTRYREVGHTLAAYAGTGAVDEALQLLNQIKEQQLRRRPAFVDELEQAEARILQDGTATRLAD